MSIVLAIIVGVLIAVTVAYLLTTVI